MNRAGVWTSRRLVAGALAAFGSPTQGTQVLPVREHVDGGQVRGEWLWQGASQHGDSAVLYLHGSAFMLASARTHRGLTSRLAALAGVPVFSCDYRLAPGHRFPSAADDVLTAYRWLLAQGYPPERIVLAGDSAGGHLAVDLVLELGRRGESVPAAMVLFSPLIDLSFKLATERERVRRDPMISAAGARRLVGLYLAGADPDDPRLRLSVAVGTPLPPTLIQAGGAEMLAADAEHLCELLTRAGGSCELQVWPDQMHVFQALPRLSPESRLALRQAAAFVRQAVRPDQRLQESA